MKVDAKKFDWSNLYYSCSRCNSIKSSTHRDLLNCADGSIDIFREIKIKMPTAPDDDVIVEPSSNNPPQEVINTVNLLKECYNKSNTALRGVSREALIEQLYMHLATFIEARMLLRSPSTGKTIKIGAKETIEAMLTVEHPFSCFWRWQYLNDRFLTESHPDLEIGF